MSQNHTNFIIVGITTLQELIRQLQAGNFESITAQLPDMDIPVSEYEAFATWKENRYTRNCISHSDEYELILLCWQPDQKTAIHGHDGKECWVKVISGQFEEEAFELTNDSVVQTEVRTLAPYEVTSANEKNFLHALKNTSADHAMSLHLYMKPIKQCKVYNAEEDVFKTVEMSYDTIAAAQAS